METYHARLKLDHLKIYNMDRLDSLFREASCPAAEEFYGKMRGLMLSVKGIERTKVIQSILKKYSYSKFMMWRGKEFWRDISGHVKGESLLFNFDNPTRFARFDLRIDKYDKKSAVFDYDINENPLILRRMRDEVRKVNDNLFIGKLSLLLGNREIFLNYFAMEREILVKKPTVPATEEIREAEKIKPSLKIKKPRGRKKAAKKRVCKVRGCNNPHRSKGYCQKHYAQFMRGTLK